MNVKGKWIGAVAATVLLALCFFAALPRASAQSTYDADFTDRTMRVDFYHSGTATEEHVSLSQPVDDGPWPGSRTKLIDPLNLGKYMLEVRDQATNRLLYSRGFASVFGEWETTGEAKKMWRTYPESVRFPWPKHEVQVTLQKRGPDLLWRELWITAIDPNSRFVNPAANKSKWNAWSVFQNGAPAEKVDLVVLGDGYTAAELEKFHADVKRLVARLFQEDPFKKRLGDFNVWAVDTPSAESGISRPHAGIFRRSALGLHYSSFDSERYVLGYHNRSIRDAAAAAPYDFMLILMNERTYGGGGIFGLYSTAAADNAYAWYLVVHEFGHHFAALGDEYYTSDVAYETGAPEKPEPWEPNITALHDPAKLKWRDLVEPDTPLPTPWDKEAFEKMSNEYQAVRRKLRATNAPEEEMEKLFKREQELETKLLAGMKYSGKVGAFEGASYEAKGLFRPKTDCIMFSRNEVGFCPVCSRAIERMIDLYSSY